MAQDPQVTHMRKVMVVMDPSKLGRILPKGLYGDLFDRIDHIEGKHIVRLDQQKGVKIVIVDIKMKDGYTIKDLDLPPQATILDIFKVKKNTYTCLMKAVADKKMMRVVRMLDFDVIYTLPFFATRDSLTLSFISDSKTMKVMLKALEVIGMVKDIHVQKAVYQDHNPLSILTEKQKRTIMTAKRMGYYNVPRKTDSRELAKALHLSKATTLEHLRKAEQRLVEFILAGY